MKHLWNSKKHLFILGSGTGLCFCPWERQDVNIWAPRTVIYSPCFKRADLLFELHTGDFELYPEVIADINNQRTPVFMQEQRVDIPWSMKFPVELINRGRIYFTSTIAYMIAFALKQDFKEISLWGVDMADYTSYLLQRGCCEYWLGVAEGRGTKINIPPTSGLFKARLYAYNKNTFLEGVKNGKTKEKN